MGRTEEKKEGQVVVVVCTMSARPKTRADAYGRSDSTPHLRPQALALNLQVIAF